MAGFNPCFPNVQGAQGQAITQKVVAHSFRHIFAWSLKATWLCGPRSNLAPQRGGSIDRCYLLVPPATPGVPRIARKMSMLHKTHTMEAGGLTKTDPHAWPSDPQNFDAVKRFTRFGPCSSKPVWPHFSAEFSSPSRCATNSLRPILHQPLTTNTIKQTKASMLRREPATLSPQPIWGHLPAPPTPPPPSPPAPALRQLAPPLARVHTCGQRGAGCQVTCQGLGRVIYQGASGDIQVLPSCPNESRRSRGCVTLLLRLAPASWNGGSKSPGRRS